SEDRGREDRGLDQGSAHEGREWGRGARRPRRDGSRSRMPIAGHAGWETRWDRAGPLGVGGQGLRRREGGSRRAQRREQSTASHLASKPLLVGPPGPATTGWAFSEDGERSAPTPVRAGAGRRSLLG